MLSRASGGGEVPVCAKWSMAFSVSLAGLAGVASVWLLGCPAGCAGTSAPSSRLPGRIESDFSPPGESGGKHAFTDAGRRLPTRTGGPPPHLWYQVKLDVEYHEETELASLKVPVKRVGPADPSYNCHGWIFSGGRFWIEQEDVFTILEDNGYQRVSEPQAGDLVLYRDGQGNIIHTGIVRSSGPTILIESKRGAGSRFLHPLDEDFTPGRVEYYRSTREGHLLRGLGSGNSSR